MEKSVMPRGITSEQLPNLIGDSHRYKTEKGIISLIHPCVATMERYEICCIGGNLFEDIERYDTLQEAEKRIEELLT